MPLARHAARRTEVEDLQRPVDGTWRPIGARCGPNARGRQRAGHGCGSNRPGRGDAGGRKEQRDDRSRHGQTEDARGVGRTPALGPTEVRG